MLTRGVRRKSQVSTALPCLSTHFLATILTKDVGSTLEESIPLPLSSPSPPPLQRPTAFFLVHVLLRKEEKGQGVTDRIKGLERGPLGIQCTGAMWSKEDNSGG